MAKTKQTKNRLPNGDEKGSQNVIDLGHQLRTERKNRNMSLKELANLVDVSVGFLSQVENGKNTPSLTTLKRIATALGLTIGKLLGEESSGEQSTLVRVSERHRLANIVERGVEIEFLSPFDTRNSMEVCIHIVDPGSKSGIQPYMHEGEEIFYVISGHFEMSVNGETFCMREGDCYYLNDCTLQHMFSNLDANNSGRMMCITTPPYFYACPKHDNEKGGKTRERQFRINRSRLANYRSQEGGR